MAIMEPVKRRALSADAKDRLRTYILEEDLYGNRKLPPEAELARQLSVSRVTIRRSLSELEQEGLILRIHGRGTFANPAAAGVKVNLALMMEFGTVIERNGYHSEYKLTYHGHEQADEEIARALQVARTARIIRVDKLHYADKKPIIASIGRVASAIFDEEPPKKVWAETLNFEVLRQYAGRIVVRDRVEFDTVTLAQAEDMLGRALPIKAASLLVMRAVGYDQNNMPVIHGIAFYDTGRLQVSLLRTSSDG